MANITAINTTNEIDQHIWSALKNSLYTGARDESIKMVLDYCKAAKLDPMQKPVHIVPMSVRNAVTGKYEYKDVVMPGVGLYRIQAARSNQYAGVSEPEFGEDVTCNLGGVEITYPKWCRVTVKKIVNNTIVEFTAKEYWLENYASKKDERTPNTMWQKRPYGQIAKCAEAQALRKAFPEFGAQPTADEMEGKALYEESTIIDGSTGEIVNDKKPKELPFYTDDQLDRNIHSWQEAINAGKTTPTKIVTKISSGYRLTEEQIERIHAIKKQMPEVDPFVAEMEAEEKGENQ